MNPNLCRVVLRPRNGFEVFDLAWRFLSVRWSPFVRMFALIYLPLWVTGSVAGFFLDWHWGVGVVVLALGVGMKAPFTLLTGRLMFADSVSVFSVLWDALRRFPQWITVAVLHLMAGVLATVTCGLSALPTTGGLLWVSECVLLEQRQDAGLSGGWNAARRSWHLAGQGPAAAVYGVFGSLFLTVWFMALGEATGSVITGFLLQFGTPFGSPWDLQVTPWMLFGLLAAQPIVAAYRLLLYVDTRTRVEGWDLQVALRAAGLL